MKRFLIGAFVAVSLFALVSEAKAQNVNGFASIQLAGGKLEPAQSFRVKFCKADNNFAVIPGACTTSNPTLLSGFFGFDVRFGSGFYYMYLWRDNTYWGSETYPAVGPLGVGNSPGGNTINGVYSRPRALPPVAVNPVNNSVNKPTSFTLQWSDGLDPFRRDPNWIVTYDIYASGNEFPELLVYSNIPCNGFGTCNVNVSGLVYTTRYQWRVVARMKSPNLVPGFGENVYLTSSDTLRFSTMFDPSTPTYSFRTSNGNKYLTAPSGGGGDFVATAGNIDSLTSQFKIIDVNGGQLMSGDAVHIQTNRNYFLMAFNGGGGDVATSGWAMSWETFTILKVGGTGAISGGDSIALLGSNGIHYLVAEGGGGGTVNCNRTAVGPWETFTLVQQ
jgi:hypothetical protein